MEEPHSSHSHAPFSSKTLQKSPLLDVQEDENRAAMFYSQCLLSNKGPLANVWVAACCLKRLKKRQVTDTNIPSSVDKILLEGLSSVTYRILAYLLLGVVRIYSRKVEYLFKDCHEAVSDINRFSVGKKVVPFKDIVRSTPSIILPKRYELDAFQLEAAEGADGKIVAQIDDIVLQDAGKDTYERSSLNKNPLGEISPHQYENYEYDALPPAWITMQQETHSSTQTPEKLTGNLGTSTSGCTPPDIVLSPYQIDIATDVNSPDHIKSLERSKEKLRELRLTQRDFMDIDDMFCGVDDELLNLINEYQFHKTDDGDKIDPEEVVLQDRDYVIPEDKEVPFSAEKTAKSEVLDTAGDTTPEFVVVPTPAKKENIRRPSKRKCIVDEIIVLDNQVMKQSINDASDLVCKRRKGPHTVIDIWRFSHIPTHSKIFAEPLIPCAARELQHVLCVNTERIESSSNAAAKPVEITEVLKPPDAASPRTPADSRSIIAPGTPVRGPTSVRAFLSPKTTDSDGENPFQAYENMRKDYSVLDYEDYVPTLMDEMGANEGDSQELRKDKNGLSARTRTVASYLHRVMHEKKQQGEETITLLSILQRKTRAETARFFFEILVLSSRGFVNVMQEKAYDDVLLQETEKMEATLKSN